MTVRENKAGWVDALYAKGERRRWERQRKCCASDPRYKETRGGSTGCLPRHGGGNSSLAYEIEYSPEAEQHLRLLTTRDRAIVLDAVDERLAHEASVETTNRRPMRPNPVAPWELRIGDLRVYYDISEEPDKIVYVRAIGVKERNTVRIGGEEIRL